VIGHGQGSNAVVQENPPVASSVMTAAVCMIAIGVRIPPDCRNVRK